MRSAVRSLQRHYACLVAQTALGPVAADYVESWEAALERGEPPPDLSDLFLAVASAGRPHPQPAPCRRLPQGVCRGRTSPPIPAHCPGHRPCLRRARHQKPGQDLPLSRRPPSHHTPLAPVTAHLMTLHNPPHHCLESRRSVPQPVIPAKAGTQDAPFRHCLENRLLAEVVSHANRHSRESGNPGIGVRPPIFVGCGVGRGQHGGLLRKTPPVCGRGRAGAAKRGGGEAAARKLPLVTAKPPIVVGCGVGRQPHMRDSRESGNPGCPPRSTYQSLPAEGGEPRRRPPQ